MRAALYARYSSDGQNPASIADQLVAARKHAERLGAVVVGEFTDAAISGKSRVGREGLFQLVEAARAGAFDVVIAEALDRMTRSGGDAWDLYDELRFAGVSINTIAEGAVGTLHVGFKGTVGALELEANALRVRRGMTGSVAAGRYQNVPPYGYRRKVVHDARGERIPGQIEIDEAQAGIVRRIGAEFLAGSRGLAIARRLNEEGVPGPRGSLWENAHIMGVRATRHGILRNPVYGGEIVWGRVSRIKDRRTGKVRMRENGDDHLVRSAAPHLAIFDAATWAAIAAEVERRSKVVQEAGNASAGNAPRRLFAGMVKCGLCGGRMATSGPGPRYRCKTRDRHGDTACTNNRSPLADLVEAQAMERLRADLLHPDVVDAAVRVYHEARKARAMDAGARRATIQRDLAETVRRAERLVDQVADGHLSGATVQSKLRELETRRAQLEAELAQAPASADVVALFPGAADRYRRAVDALSAQLDAVQADPKAAAARDAAWTALRQVVRRVIVHPGEKRATFSVSVEGDLTALLNLAAPLPTNLRQHA